MVQSIERPTQTSGGVFTCYPIGGNSHKPHLEPVRKGRELTYPQPIPKCECGRVFQQDCGHRNCRPLWAPDDKWTCESCRRRRIREEVIPEIRLVLLLAKEKCETLKFLTLTAEDGYMGGDTTAP